RPSRHKSRQHLDSEVALAFVVEDPGHKRRMRRARQAVGKRRTQHLLDCEAFSKTDDRQRYGAENNNKPVKEYFQHGRELSRGTMTRRLEFVKLFIGGLDAARSTGILSATGRVRCGEPVRRPGGSPREFLR